MTLKGKEILKKDGYASVFTWYTLVFCIYVSGIFALLILSHRTFIQFHDAYRQGLFRLIEMRNQLHNVLSGEGFHFWSWYEGTGIDEPLENFVDPFSLIGSLFPSRYLELGFTVAALLRMYFGGIAFILVGKETGLKKEQNIAGAVLYVFTACFIGLALRQSELLYNAYLFPLLVLGVDRICKGKRPTVFILTVAYYMLISTYYAYMSAIGILMYIILRWFAYNDGFSVKEYAAYLGRFIVYGLTGMAISAVGSVFSFYTLMRASTEGSDIGGVLIDHYYSSLGQILLGTAATFDYLDIGLPVVIFMLLPFALRKCTKRSTNTIMTVILFIMLLIPFFGIMFNGFSYWTLRWSYMFVFFATWSAAEQLDADTLVAKRAPLLAGAGLAVIACWTMLPYTLGEADGRRSALAFILLQLAAGAFFWLLLVYAQKKKLSTKKMTAAILIVSFFTLSGGWACGFIGRLDAFIRNATMYSGLEDSTLRAGDVIEDSGFYRIDSVDGMMRKEVMAFPVNENIWWKTNNLFIYNSIIPKSLTEFNVEMGNGYGYARRVYVLSNENRMGLDFIYAVRYYLGNDEKKEGYEESDLYAPYGFEKTGETDGVTVFKNKYDVDMGFVLGKAMLKSEFDKLNRVQREQALLQAAVIPDEKAEELGMTDLAKAEDLDFDIQDIPYEISDLDGVTFEDGKIITDKKHASFVLNVHDVPECQLMVSFDNLLRNSVNGDDGSAFEIQISEDEIDRTIPNDRSRQGVPRLRDHDANLGHFEDDGRIKITLSRKGVYTYDRMYVSAMSLENYDKYASECIDNKFTVERFSDSLAEGKVNAKKDGILFLSITAPENWDIYIDGEKAEEIEGLDITFFGAPITKGEHEVTLRYKNNYVRYGGLISIIGLIVLVLLIIKKPAGQAAGSERTS